MIQPTCRRHRRVMLGAESGVALMATLMVLVLLSSLLVGFTAMVAFETRLGGIDARSADSFYAAHAGIEKLTSELGQLFSIDFSPPGDAVRALADNAPDLDGVSWVEPDGSDGYRVGFLTTTGDPATGEPVAVHKTVTEGPFPGFIGLMTEYTVGVHSTVAARRRELAGAGTPDGEHPSLPSSAPSLKPISASSPTDPLRREPDGARANRMRQRQHGWLRRLAVGPV